MKPEHARRLLDDEAARLGELIDAQSHQVAGARGHQVVSEASPGDQHLADAAADLTERETEQSLLDQAERRLNAVSEAISKLDRGAYGSCEICGTGISDERLEHRPETKYCATHRQQIERVADV